MKERIEKVGDKEIHIVSEMTDTEKRVREQIAKTLNEFRWECQSDRGKNATIEFLVVFNQAWINQILSIPGLAIRSDDQSLPNTIDILNQSPEEIHRDMLKAGFRKVVW
jgi:hypothetical protein